MIIPLFKIDVVDIITHYITNEENEREISDTEATLDNKYKYSDTKVALALGIQRRNLRKHQTNIQSNQFKWLGLGRRRRCDALSTKIIERVGSFWAKNTRVSPNRKYI